MVIELVAKLKTAEEFFEQFKSEDIKIERILFYALSNTKPEDRYKISKFLIENGANVNELNSEGYNALQVLLDARLHIIEETAILCRELIKRGVDINHKDKYGQVAFVYIIRMNNFSDSELEELYDVFLSQDNLNLLDKDKFNNTPIEYAEGLPYREIIYERMKKYVSQNR
ncbi:ankyrin repeat domain-containing protein [Parvimonas micra]|uniref:ankyrin repeat domain-containing protein n=1 Tax=Parvimonas micra TaxID=33033 RepID=UPI000401023E|nr:ankyrin repeat domain-containing protein [Parvimonas micra]